MAIDIAIGYDFVGATTMEKLVAQMLSTNPAAAMKAAQKSAEYMKKVQAGALRMTGARLRKRMIEVFQTPKILNWPEHKKHPHRSGQSGSIADLTYSNKAQKAYTKSGSKKKRGYSTKKPIKPARPKPMGGKFRNAMGYKVADDTMIVGLGAKKGKKDYMTVFQKFQEGGSPITKGFQGGGRRYLAALGFFMRSPFRRQIPARPLIAPIERRHPPRLIFEEAFNDLFIKNFRLGEE